MAADGVRVGVVYISVLSQENVLNEPLWLLYHTYTTQIAYQYMLGYGKSFGWAFGLRNTDIKKNDDWGRTIKRKLDDNHKYSQRVPEQTAQVPNLLIISNKEAYLTHPYQIKYIPYVAEDNCRLVIFGAVVDVLGGSTQQSRNATNPSNYSAIHAYICDPETLGKEPCERESVCVISRSKQSPHIRVPETAKSTISLFIINNECPLIDSSD